jgi:hypothetical protein
MEKMMILITGPYRSGTNDNPALIAKNMEQMNNAAYEVYKKGHLPVLGEWFALPLVEKAGSRYIGDEIFNQIFHPISIDILNRCDAVLRIGGASKGADAMVIEAINQGKGVFYQLNEIPQ